eukprot:1690762-Karenia_brevis.AAC.1
MTTLTNWVEYAQQAGTIMDALAHDAALATAAMETAPVDPIRTTNQQHELFNLQATAAGTLAVHVAPLRARPGEIAELNFMSSSSSSGNPPEYPNNMQPNRSNGGTGAVLHVTENGSCVFGNDDEHDIQRNASTESYEDNETIASTVSYESDVAFELSEVPLPFSDTEEISSTDQCIINILPEFCRGLA